MAVENLSKVDLKKMNQEFKQALKLIKENDKIVVYRHVSPDYDAFGSQMGLATWIKLNFPHKEVYYVGESHQTFVPTLFPQPLELSEEWYDHNKGNFLAIVCDTGNKKRVSTEHLDLAKTTIKFDHHPNLEPYANLNIVYDRLSSCSELISLFIYSLPLKYKVNSEICSYLYTGIVGDSGRFLYQSTSPTTLRLAAELVIGGADMKSIYDKMYQSDWKMLNFKKYVLNNYKFTKGGVCYYILDKKTLDQLDIKSNEANIMLSEFRNLAGVDVCVSITEVEDGEFKYRVSVRSNSKVIGPTMNKFNGGGHDYAAGGGLNDLKEVDALIKALEEC